MKTFWQQQMFTLLTVIGFALITHGQSLPTQSSLARAKELWELAIAAKGGREALYKIHSIAEIRDEKGKNVTFVVLPDKYFTWFDARPGQLGLDVKLYNFESGFGYRNYGVQGGKVYRDIHTHPDFSLIKGRLPELMYIQLFWLLETRWVQPKPIFFMKDKVSGKSVDRVDVLIEGNGPTQRFAIYLDEKTHLPVRIAMCQSINSEEISDFCCFSNKRAYVEMEGIKIPIESSGKNTPWETDHVELNPEYDPQFFNRVPDHNASGLQWRITGAKPVAPSVIPQPEPLTPTQITQLVKNLGASDEELRQAALRYLLAVGKQALPALTEALHSSSNNPMHRYNIAVIMLKADEQNPTATVALADLVTDARLNSQARQDAAFGLLCNQQGIAALVELLGSSDVFVRRFAIFAFDELTERVEIPRQTESAIPTLRRLTQDKDEVVRKMAIEVLDQIELRLKHK